MKRIPLALLLALVLASPAVSQGHELVVSAAASLTDVLGALKAEAELRCGTKITYNFGGSGALRKQIEEGAPVDVFFSAASEDVDKLEKAGLLEPGSRHDLLSNAIVLVGGEGQPAPNGLEALRSLLSSSPILAIGNPDSVPAGRYAVQALKSLGLYDAVDKKLALGGNVRQVLQYVESGSAPLGIVFLTDAMSVKAGSPVKRLYVFPDEALQTPVLYPAAVVAASKEKEAAARFIAFLGEKRARDVFAAAGFTVR